MDNNWLMAALQSPEGMNFLNMWRQKMGMPGTGGMNQGSFSVVGGGQIPGTGGMNQGAYNPAKLGISTMPFQPPNQSAATQGFGVGMGISRSGGNDISGQNAMPSTYWNPGN